MAGKKFITFYGWNGKWWRKIKVGKAAYDAASFVLPLKWGIVQLIAEETYVAIRKHWKARR